MTSLFAWRDGNTLMEAAGAGNFEATHVAEPFLPSSAGDDGRELRKLVAGLLGKVW
jgi:hypothetical protein